MTKQTKATEFLTASGVPFSVHDYEYAPGGGLIGMQAAQSIGADPACVLKTLVVEVDRKTPACLVVPADHKVNFKKVAALFGGRNARMMSPEKSAELTGFRSGGTSPFGQEHQLPVILSADAMACPHVYVNAGDRGLVVRIAPADAQKVVAARVADISAAPAPAEPIKN
ncbi:Cys-tRNA(Pro)/Cys-tRNA(Cys) deacylase YbaK [Komagataeibacter europaeus]|uniref:Cys-tRNA(Pro)/Cys-tRNA(Cys) deacylase n=1 Tax=Komagataeibacter europaeus TaxID=33995 RepID=A0A0M0EIW0_KOMEU|nr:aminoacyl-tRNA deacylase [Komagataeibacter europaeus]KON65195.1 Cys-tRNA(Pro)/Cys-tRNA(Cys) deacylase YbaK [Komagataeibacter europaeus]